MTEDGKTIIAVATPFGAGAIGIIRISGDGALSGVRPYFSGFKSEVQPGKMYYGELKCGAYTDKCMCAYFAAPHSYTGEDTVELYCHGSSALLYGITAFLIDNSGFVQAEGGDFTARAFKNGKLDLTEAEGVYDIINAESEAEIRGAYSLLSGALKERIEEIQRLIVSARAGLEAAIDYPEEDVEEETAAHLKLLIDEIKEKLDALTDSYKCGRLLKDGVKVALIGKPNAGKSSIMNALLGYDRAIVTEEKGTTRDTLTESYIYKGVKFVVTDTAGLREAQSLPERIGIKRAYAAAEECDVVVAVTEAGAEDKTADSIIVRLKKEGRKVIVAENKIDLKPASRQDSLKVSALHVIGIEKLKEIIYLESGALSGGGAMLNNARQYGAAKAAAEHIGRACKNVLSMPPELISADLYEAYAALGRITGITGSDALAEEIFKKFCVGK
ncbi:MAG: tRNA uridine-5-carboxymethylaminomethyl(34) synthesis GTPase MnmE [Christensenellales bacterium]